MVYIKDKVVDNSQYDEFVLQRHDAGREQEQYQKSQEGG